MATVTIPSDASTRSTSPPVPVMVWDSATQSFTKRIPAPHSSMTIDSTLRTRLAPLASPTNSSNSSSSPTTRRMRRYSNPESVLDFDEFLKQIERERPTSSVPSHNSAPDDNATASKVEPVSKSATKQGGKNPLKTVLKEVLGGGGNNNEPAPKDAVVYSFGRGGVARAPVKGKATAAPSHAKTRDPYYAHVPFGSPPAPATQYFPPNSNVPRTKSQAAENFSSSYGGSDGYVPERLHTRTYSRPTPPTDPYGYSLHALEEQSRPNRYGAPSPAPTSSSTSTNSADGNEFSAFLTKNAQSQIPMRIVTTDRTGRRARPRAKSFTSPTSPIDSPVQTPPQGTGIGVFLHPEQAALEAQLAEMTKKKMEKSDDVKVTIAAVPSSEDLRRGGREVDVVAVADAEMDDESASVMISSFPMPPRKSSREVLDPRHRSQTASGAVTPMGPRRPLPLQQQGRFPTMPAPGSLYHYPTGNVPLHSLPPREPAKPQLTLPDENYRLPPPPSRPPPVPQPQSLPPCPGGPPSIPLPPLPKESHIGRRGSAPAAGSVPYDVPFSRAEGAPSHYQIPPITPVTPSTMHHPFASEFPPDLAAILSQLNGLGLGAGSPVSPGPSFLGALEEDFMLQQQRQTEALERERQELEERVRGLMWLVNSLEEQQASPLPGPQELPPLSPPEDASIRSPGPSQIDKFDKRSSTSTDRTVTLPYLRR